MYIFIKPLLVGEEGFIFPVYIFVYYVRALDDVISELFLELLQKVSFYINKVVVVVVLVVEELHYFLMVCILIGIDNAFAFSCFGNYDIVAKEFFFHLLQDILFFFIKKCVVVFYIICNLVCHILLFRCG